MVGLSDHRLDNGPLFILVSEALLIQYSLVGYLLPL